MKYEVSIGQKKSQLEANPMHHYRENELNSDHMISLFADNYPGISADECMAMVYKPQPKMAKHTSQPQPAGFSESKSIFWCVAIQYALRFMITYLRILAMGTYDSTWHSVEVDGVLTRNVAS